jgi:hypothetical protein
LSFKIFLWAQDRALNRILAGEIVSWLSISRHHVYITVCMHANSIFISLYGHLPERNGGTSC